MANNGASFDKLRMTVMVSLSNHDKLRMTVMVSLSNHDKLRMTVMVSLSNHDKLRMRTTRSVIPLGKRGMERPHPGPYAPPNALRARAA